MTNSYWNVTSTLTPHQKAKAEDLNPMFAGIGAGFDKLPEPDALIGGANVGTTTGSGAAYVVTLGKPFGNLFIGAQVRVKIHATSLASPTINVGTGVKQIRDWAGETLAAGVLPAGAIATMNYDGSFWRLENIVSPSVISGYGIGAATGGPLVADFHTVSLGAGLYTWNGATTANPPVSGAVGGSALLSYRGAGQATWIAWEMGGASGSNEPSMYVKSTSSVSNDWGVWLSPLMVVETGSGSNGSYRKFSDGRMICEHVVSFSAAIDLGFAGGFRCSPKTWTFPAAFNAAPIVIPAVTGLTAISAAIESRTTTTATYGVTAVTSQGSATRTVQFQAYGTWR